MSDVLREKSLQMSEELGTFRGQISNERDSVGSTAAPSNASEGVSFMSANCRILQRSLFFAYPSFCGGAA